MGWRDVSSASGRLKQAREQAGFASASEAARHHGWKTSSYIAHENGQNHLRVAVAKTYAKAFGCDPEWLLFDRAVAGSGASRLREARMKANFATAADAARHFGWAAQTYFAHENGHRGLKPAMAKLYAEAFGCEPEWLLFGDASEQLQPAPRVLEIPLDLDPDLLESWKALKRVDRVKLIEIARILAGRRERRDG